MVVSSRRKVRIFWLFACLNLFDTGVQGLDISLVVTVPPPLRRLKPLLPDEFEFNSRNDSDFLRDVSAMCGSFWVAYFP
jgi:hypothetical protein